MISRHEQSKGMIQTLTSFIFSIFNIKERRKWKGFINWVSDQILPSFLKNNKSRDNSNEGSDGLTDIPGRVVNI
jgi:hypothetical protein